MIRFDFKKDDIISSQITLIDRDMSEISLIPENISMYNSRISFMINMSDCVLKFEDSIDMKILILSQFNKNSDLIRLYIFYLGYVDFDSIDKYYKFTYKVNDYRHFYIQPNVFEGIKKSEIYLNSLKRDLKISDILN